MEERRGVATALQDVTYHGVHASDPLCGGPAPDVKFHTVASTQDLAQVQIDAGEAAAQAGDWMEKPM